MSRTPGVLVLVGAYGRDATVADWEAGKDFQILNGPYCSIRDLENMRKMQWKLIEIVNRARETVLEVKL